MRVLFDENLPPALAIAINALAKGKSIGATSLVELYGSGGVPDQQWLGDLEKQDIVGVITQDYFDKTPVEFAAYQQTNIPFFYLAHAYNRMDLWKKASLLLLKWPVICQQIEVIKGFAEFEIPANHNAHISQLRRKRR